MANAYTLDINLRVVLGALWGLAGIARAEVTPPFADREIVLKHTEPARVVVLEHTGPYWTIGRLLRRVGEAMEAHNEAGPMFARYLADPTAVPADSLRTEVGFVVRGDWKPETPFRIAQRESELVVSFVAEGPYGTTMQYYPEIRRWMSAHDCEALGPVIELYSALPSGAPGGPPRTEIQFPVRRASWARDATRQSGAEARSNPNLDPRLQDSPANDIYAGPSKEPLSTIRALWESWRFDRIAEQLVPTDRPMSAGMQIWLGQVVFRVRAVANGLEQTYEVGSPAATALSEALVSRYRQVSASSKVDPLEQVVVRVDTRSDPQSATKRRIVGDLDNLLGHVALKAVDSETACERLIPILQRVQVLTNPALPPE